MCISYRAGLATRTIHNIKACINSVNVFRRDVLVVAIRVGYRLSVVIAGVANQVKFKQGTTAENNQKT